LLRSRISSKIGLKKIEVLAKIIASVLFLTSFIKLLSAISEGKETEAIINSGLNS